MLDSYFWTVIFVQFGLESNDRNRSTKCLSLYMGKNQSSYLFCPFGSLFGQIIKMLALLTKLGRSECEPSSSHALVQTSLRSVCTGDLDSTKISYRFAMT